ncbi:MAG TPA: peptidylprolyl isomerase [Pyrinomonadaceae bacterium]|nr:peptidylprolyl isomerase [Pyrinomonadaceae bacterium]
MFCRTRKSLLVTVAVLVAAFAVSGQSIKTGTKYCVDTFGPQEFSILLKDMPAETKKKLESAEFRSAQRDSIRELFAMACEAEKRGLAVNEINASELDNIRMESLATAYDSKLGGSVTPFARITRAQVINFYKSESNTAAFERFLNTKLELAGQPEAADTGSEEQAKEVYAKTRMTADGYLKAKATLDSSFVSEVELQVVLQQSQFLARQLSEVIANEGKVTDAEIAAYIAAHPEFDTSAKKELAEKLLVRAKAGEDFAKLADQYSNDPGNVGPDGRKNGGLYRGIEKGRMLPAFEDAALSLQPGGIYPTLVKTSFGYHVIKLDSKVGAGPAIKYYARHIVISTGYKDPKDPASAEKPVDEYVRGLLEDGKFAAIKAKIIANNSVNVAEIAFPAQAKTGKPN